MCMASIKKFGGVKMKKIYLALIVFISFIACGMSMASAKGRNINNTNIIEVNVKGANVKLKKGKSDTIETKYYGKASDANYNLETKMDGNKYKITLNYTGGGIAPTIEEGGVIVKIPDDVCSLLCINGKEGAGIDLNEINFDTDIITESCAVIINDKNSSKKISILSMHDSYEINSVPITEDFHLKSIGSVVEYTFTEQPLNLEFKLTGGYAELPVGWSRNFSLGLGWPRMIVEVDNGIFELSVNN